MQDKENVSHIVLYGFFVKATNSWKWKLNWQRMKMKNAKIINHMLQYALASTYIFFSKVMFYFFETPLHILKSGGFLFCRKIYTYYIYKASWWSAQEHYVMITDYRCWLRKKLPGLWGCICFVRVLQSEWQILELNFSVLYNGCAFCIIKWTFLLN